jgi:hypothetical protein
LLGALRSCCERPVQPGHLLGQRITPALSIAAHTPLYVATLCSHRNLLADVAALQADYTALMYGGTSPTQVGTRFDKPCPANAFSSGAFSNLFYK